MYLRCSLCFFVCSALYLVVASTPPSACASNPEGKCPADSYDEQILLQLDLQKSGGREKGQQRLSHENVVDLLQQVVQEMEGNEQVKAREAERVRRLNARHEVKALLETKSRQGDTHLLAKELQNANLTHARAAEAARWGWNFWAKKKKPKDIRKKTSRVAIIGAGPSGLHMASRLGKLGYTDVTVLERTHRVGGKSYTLYRDAQDQPCEQKKDPATGKMDTSSCVAHDMGTCYLHNAYHTVRELVEEYGITAPVHTDEESARAVFIKAAGGKGLTTGDYVLFSLKLLMDQGKLKGAIKQSKKGWIPGTFHRLMEMGLAKEDKLPMILLMDGLARYNDIHHELFPDVPYTMPPRPSGGVLAHIDMTFGEFLDQNDLSHLAPFLKLAQSAQGYGYINSIPAFYGLSWITPELLNGYFQQTLHSFVEKAIGEHNAVSAAVVGPLVQKLARLMVGGSSHALRHITTVMPEGYAKIWKNMHEKDEINVKFGVSIKAGGIKRNLKDKKAPVQITYVQDGGQEVTEDYDFLIYSANHADAHNFVSDLTEKEQSMFGGIVKYVLSTTLYKGDAVEGYSDAAEAPIMYKPDVLNDKSNDGRWYTDRNDLITKAGLKHHIGQRRVGYQFFEDPCAAAQGLCNSDRSAEDEKYGEPLAQVPELVAELKKDLEAAGSSNIKVLQQMAFPYFHHYSQENVRKGLPWDLFDMQGQSKTWWIGASAIFESVLDVTNYNLELLNDKLDADYKGNGMEHWWLG